MAIKVSDILKKTLVLINEYSADMEEQEFAEEALGAQAKDDVMAHIDAAARMVAQVAPANMQEATTNNAFQLTLNARPDGRLHGTANLPSDYMRLVYLLSNSLYRPITVLLPSTHPTYAMQFCPIAGIGNGAYSPVGYLVDGTVDVHGFQLNNDNDNSQESTNNSQDVDYYGEIGADTLEVTIMYLTLPKVEKATAGEFYGIAAGEDMYKKLKEELRDVIAMQAAALYLSMTDNDKAAVAQQMASGMIAQLTVDG